MSSRDILADAPQEVQEMFARLWKDVHAAEQKRAIETAKADPRRYRHTLIFGDVAATYRYAWAGRDGAGNDVRYCWSCHRNVAGYFLTWREMIGPHGGRRTEFAARKVRKKARAIAHERAEKFKTGHEAALYVRCLAIFKEET